MRGILTTIALLLCGFASAQTSPYDDLRLATTDSTRLLAHGAISQHLNNLLTSSQSLAGLEASISNWPFGKASAGEGEDKAIVLTWNAESEARSQDYGGVVVFASEDEDAGFDWVELTHDKGEDITDEGRSYREDDWTGALYYQMILQYDGKTPVYTLLGWDGADGVVTRKIIETMSISNGRVRIGTPYISRPDGLKKRHVLEYSDILQVTVKYEEELNRIIIDHLAPSDPSLQGKTEFYGPTLELDAYTWDMDKWVLSFDVEVRNSKDIQKHRPYHEPRPSRRRK
jgi:hypothetical protein